MNVRRIARLAACVAALLGPVFGTLPALAQGIDAVLMYRGADREARLVERAKQEGSVVLYTSLAPTESRRSPMLRGRRYHKVELWLRALGQYSIVPSPRPPKRHASTF